MDQAPEKLGDFKIRREIGRGGMGIVYEARQRSLRRAVALKVLPEAATTRAAAIARFRREAEVLARLDHRGIVKVFAFGAAASEQWIAMELVLGASLAKVLLRLAEHGFVGLDGSYVGAAVLQEMPRLASVEPPTASLDAAQMLIELSVACRSISASSSSVNPRRSSAATLSSSCATLDAPIRADVTRSSRSAQASAICARL